MKRRAARWLLLVGLLGLAAPVRAHPVPRDNHDRTIVVRLTPEAVLVDYRLEVDELTAALELLKVSRQLGADALAQINDRRQLPAVYLRFHAPYLADNLVASLDGKPLTFRCVATSFKLLDHVRCDLRFRADWQLGPGQEHRFAFREGNYELDSVSRIGLHLGRSTRGARLQLGRVLAPDEELLARPAAERQPGDEERLRTLQAVVALGADDPAGVYKPALPPDLPLVPAPTLAGAETKDGPHDGASRSRPLAVEGSRGQVARFRSADGSPVQPAETAAPVELAEAGQEGEPDNLLHLLLDTRLGMGLLLLLAAAFGAVHALTPGHGKTMVAAYLVGERGTFLHALFLGVVVTITHTAAVILLAALLPLFFPETPPASVQRVLGLTGGLLIAGLGLWLLLRRLAGQADHIHIGGGHHHHHHGHHPHHHHHDHLPQGVGWGALVVLGVSGGIVPCWDAIAMLGLAISAQRLWLGLPLLLAFSAGLAAVLILLGVGVVWAHRYAGRRWGESQRWHAVVRVLPLISAALITAMGLWLCYASVH